MVKFPDDWADRWPVGCINNALTELEKFQDNSYSYTNIYIDYFLIQ